MSRGFVKEDDQEEIPIVTPRAYLPEGVTNFVTPKGMEELQAEKQEMMDEKESLNLSNENENRIAMNHVNSKLQLLMSRITSARVINLAQQDPELILFGALVTLKVEGESKHLKYQIVGVDEADISKDKISFLSPIARVLINKKVGEKAILILPKEDRVFEILAIEY